MSLRPFTRFGAIVASIALLLFTASRAAAQPTAPLDRATRGLRLVYVTDNDGQVRACGLVAREPAGLRVLVRNGELFLPWEDIARVHAVGDPIHDGFVKGALVGGGLAAFATWMGEGEPSGEQIVGVALAYGLIGAVMDGFHVGTTTLYVAPGMSSASRHGHSGAGRPNSVVVGARVTF